MMRILSVQLVARTDINEDVNIGGDDSQEGSGCQVMK
jgi:hypothetical protein